MTIIIRSVFKEGGKLHLQVYLEECFVWVCKQHINAK